MKKNIRVAPKSETLTGSQPRFAGIHIPEAVPISDNIQVSEYDAATIFLDAAEARFLLASGWQRHADYKRNGLWIAPEFNGWRHINGTFGGDQLKQEQAMKVEKAWRETLRLSKL